MKYLKDASLMRGTYSEGIDRAADAPDRRNRGYSLLRCPYDLTCIIHEGTASGCWEREDAGGSVILVAWPCC